MNTPDNQSNNEETLLRILFDTMPQLGWTARPDGFIDYYNRGWYEYTGTTYDQMQGWGWESVHDPDLLPGIKARWQAAIAAGQPVELEFPLRRWDGVFRWFLTRVQPIRDQSGTLTRWVGINTDIDDQRTAREQLQQQRTRYLALFSQAPAAIGLLSGPSHVVDLANPLMCDLWGRRLEQVLGKPIAEALPEIRGQGFIELLDRVFRTGQRHVGNESPARLNRQGNGTLETVFFNFVYEPVRNHAGDVDGIAAIAVDVTPQVLARDALADRVRQSDFEASVGTALTSDAPLPLQLTRCCEAMVNLGAAFARIWVLDETNEVLELRASAGIYTHLDGGHSRVPVGQYKIGLIAAERRAHLTNDVVDDPRVSDPDWARREGLTAFAGYPMMLGERLVGVMALFARDPLDEATLKALGTVARQIALAVERDRIERFRELFIGILGHDLRNPLNAINMGAHTLAASPEVPPRPRWIAERIQRSGQRMSRMVDQLLDYTRARSSVGIPVVATPADLIAICKENIQEFQQAHPDRTFDVRTTGDGDGEWDVDRMSQVFSNLVGNAITHGAPDTDIRVTMRGDGDRVSGEVLSFGEPIAPAALAGLFDFFSRANHLRSASTSGLGLGLFITREIIQAHGGTITVSSSASEGTSFMFTVPRRRPSPSPERSPENGSCR